MAPKYEDDWSDSDEEEGSDVMTSVQLGIPDGRLESDEDLRDAAVSRIGGYPAFLTSPDPPFESSFCKNCSTPMELIIQVWCPMEDSPNDRALYVWACSRGVCQGLAGSVRAWRGLRYNERYAAKLKKKARAAEKAQAVEKAKTEASAPIVKGNPFTMKAVMPTDAFGLGSQIFGDAPVADTPQPEEDETAENSANDGDEDDESSEDEALAKALAATTLDSSEWKSAPHYDALYLSTDSEYLPPAPKQNIPAFAMQIEEGDDDKKSKDGSWAFEGYENSLDIDHAFERFSKRVGYEAEQCLRYELGGTPLAFASDDVFDKLFPVPPAPPLPVTKPASMVLPPSKRTYSPSAIPACPHCNGRRVFECQLMPNLINVLKLPAANETSNKSLTDEERRKEVEQALKGNTSVERTGMSWGTCMIFSCEQDCCEENVKSSWREELVLVQWDH